VLISLYYIILNNYRHLLVITIFYIPHFVDLDIIVNHLFIRQENHISIFCGNNFLSGFIYFAAEFYLFSFAMNIAAEF
jgi:hypothetical protein